ncbi:LOW QUALITY PROTEIN: hypothetical protein NC651_018236 [Populus alba x Populus x berolinensis]|nr:LOW QUALITY PROTEIN: hypothetical protein NC651_018236 [Populus alba x Populus x berolinensis]
MAVEEEDVESCGSKASYSAIANPSSRHHHQRQKLEVYNEVQKRIQDLNFEETNLLDDFQADHLRSLIGGFFVYPALNGNSYASVHLDPAMKEDAQSSYFSNKQGMHPPPTFGSSPNLEAFQACRYHVDDGDEIGLNIQEAHAFSIVDGFSLDIFVVDGWLGDVWSYSFHQLEKSSVRLTLFAHCTTWSCAWEPTEELRNALEKEILKSKFVLITLQLTYTTTQMPQ